MQQADLEEVEKVAAVNKIAATRRGQIEKRKTQVELARCHGAARLEFALVEAHGYLLLRILFGSLR